MKVAWFAATASTVLVGCAAKQSEYEANLKCAATAGILSELYQRTDTSMASVMERAYSTFFDFAAYEGRKVGKDLIEVSSDMKVQIGRMMPSDNRPNSNLEEIARNCSQRLPGSINRI